MALRGIILALVSGGALAHPGGLQCADERFAVGNTKKCMTLDIEDKAEHPGLRYSADTHSFARGGEVRLTVSVQKLGPYDNSSGQDPWGIYFAILASADSNSSNSGSFTAMPGSVSQKDNVSCPHMVVSGSDYTCKDAVGLIWTAGPETCGDVTFSMLWGNGPGDTPKAPDTPFLYRSIIEVSGEPCGRPVNTTTSTTTSAPAGDTWVCTVCEHVYDAAQDGSGMPFEDLPEEWLCPVCFQPKKVYKRQEKKTTTSAPVAETWVCSVCDHVYDPEQDGAGKAFEDLPEDWLCPVCAQPKSVYEKNGKKTSTSTPVADTWTCSICAHVYDPQQDGSGMAFEDLPEDWLCPVCAQPKSVYEKESQSAVLV